MSDVENTDWDACASKYASAKANPDKLFSYLPTLMDLLGDVRSKTVLDLGCGDGLFSTAIARLGAREVIGLDSSKEKIKRAVRLTTDPNITFMERDVFKGLLPPADVICAPFVLNYATTHAELQVLVDAMSACLSNAGFVVALVDLPERGPDDPKFGTEIRVETDLKDLAPLAVRLFKRGECVMTIRATYFSIPTIERAFVRAGFGTVFWHEARVSAEGFARFGTMFWDGYIERPGVGYLRAVKLESTGIEPGLRFSG